MDTSINVSMAADCIRGSKQPEHGAESESFKEVIEDVAQGEEHSNRDSEMAEVEDKPSLPNLSEIAVLLLNLMNPEKAFQKNKEGKNPELEGGKIVRPTQPARNNVPAEGLKTNVAVEENTKQAKDGTGEKAVAEKSVAVPVTPAAELPSTVEVRMKDLAETPLSLLSSKVLPSVSQNLLQSAIGGPRFELTQTAKPQSAEVREFRTSADGGETQIRVKMPNGEVVDLRLTVREGVAHVVLSTSRPELVRHLQETIHELVVGLEAGGLEVGVDVMQDDSEERENYEVARFMQNESGEEVHEESSPQEHRWHYMAIRGRVYLIA